MFKKTALFVSLLLTANAATAGMITNNSEILSAADHEQLSTWLGEDVDLTRIFAKGVDGTNSFDWHDAVDNQGRTFTIMEVFNGTDKRIAGGYNQFNWSSTGRTVQSTNKENFLFNLTSGIKYQKNNPNQIQTYNLSRYGMTFGGGHDLYVNRDLTTGYTNIGDSYGDTSRNGTDEYRNEFMGSYSNWTIGKYETFTLSASTVDFGNTVSNVPVTIAMGSLAMLGLGFGASRRRKSK
jgi:hypothetical protein